MSKKALKSQDNVQFIWENVSAAYEQDKPILTNINLSIQQGERIAIIGLSGVGKTTLLRLLGRAVPYYQGKILYNMGSAAKGENNASEKSRLVDIFSLSKAKLKDYRRKIALIFQKDYLIESVSVVDNVLLGALANLSFWRAYFFLFPQELYQKAIFLLTKFGLSDKLYVKAGSLSGGQQQRVAIARALMSEVSVIFADEPFSHLDKKNSQEVLQTLLQVNQEQNITLLINLHDVKLAKKYFSRIIGIKDGKIYKDAASKDWSDEEVKALYEN